ncbi:MAG: hypothetical protein ABSB76_38195, partial [Streptosporangiaceae bacterium]
MVKAVFGRPAGPLAAAPLAAAPLAAAPLAVAPLAVAPLAVAPLAVAPLAVALASVAAPASAAVPVAGRLAGLPALHARAPTVIAARASKPPTTASRRR